MRPDYVIRYDPVILDLDKRADPRRAGRLIDEATLSNKLLLWLVRTNTMKTAAGRARKIAALVAMLERGETIVPEPRRRTP